MSLICRWRGHNWFPDQERREFIPVQDICLRCKATRTLLPWGQCLGGHSIAEHYLADDQLVAKATRGCPGPQ